MTPPTTQEPQTEAETLARMRADLGKYAAYRAADVRVLLDIIDRQEQARAEATRTALEGVADLQTRAEFLADRAARAVTEPRRFLESADEQHDLSVAIADVRRAVLISALLTPAKEDGS